MEPPHAHAHVGHGPSPNPTQTHPMHQQRLRDQGWMEPPCQHWYLYLHPAGESGGNHPHSSGCTCVLTPRH